MLLIPCCLLCVLYCPLVEEVFVRVVGEAEGVNGVFAYGVDAKGAIGQY